MPFVSTFVRTGRTSSINQLLKHPEGKGTQPEACLQAMSTHLID